ncbi:hypothetical protein FRC09_010014 [Ceratobasidium sp. 395]|nr:hypothetical protein FRC09_010014 [Ceratobasidium sp. 395]
MLPHHESRHQCPFCQKSFGRKRDLRSHQTQKKHYAPPAPDPIPLDEIMDDVDPTPLSPTPLTVPSADDESAHIPPSENDLLSGLSPPAHASTPRASDRGDSSQMSDDPGALSNILGDAAPYGVATNEDELRITIQRVLEDMIQRTTGSDNQPPPEPSGSVQASSEASGSASAQPNRFVTMRRLPEDIDEAVSKFLSHLLRENSVSAEADPAANPDGNGDDTDTEDDDLTNEVYGDTRSENGSEQFYTAVNNSVDDLIDNLSANNADETNAEQVPETLANAAWGTPLRRCQPMLTKIHRARVAAGQSPDWPFADYLEFEFVKWMVVNDVSQTARDKLIKLPIMERCGLSFGSNYALNKLLDKLPSAGPRWTRIQRTITGTVKDAKGKPLQEDIEIWVRDIVELVRELIGNASYGHKLVFVPQRVETNGNRKIDEIKLPPGATVVPIILSSDATQLTNFSGGKSAWPVYITIGNIPKSIRAKINTYSSLLLAYLPVPKLDCFPKSERGDRKARLFHECMTEILKPLVSAGEHGVEMDCGDGYVRHCYPILAAYIADNPEQTLVAGCKRNVCHRCTVPEDERGDLPNQPPPPRIPDHTAVALEAQSLGHTSSLFHDQGLKPFGKPFWADLPHTNIFTCLTPDILHQLHKGVFKDHLMKWCLQLIERADKNLDNVDYRYMAMPDHSNLRHFSSGVSKLKQTTAHEHREMQKVFMAVMAGLVPNDVLPAILAVIDFIHFARLPVHTTATLDLLDEALDRFHEHKHVFIKYNIRTDFNINKIHAMCHYTEAILALGTADAYNTETPERLHIEFAKRAYKATNRRNFFQQMTVYLERREKVNKFDAYLKSIHPEYAARDLDLEKDLEDGPGQFSANGWKIAKKSPIPRVPITLLSPVYKIEWFAWCLSEFLEQFHRRAVPIDEKHDRLEVFPKATQVINNAFSNDLVDRVHASPVRLGGSTKSRFDTALIRRGRAAEAGQLSVPSYGISTHYIGRIRLIFKLPTRYRIDDTLVLVQLFHVTSTTQPNKKMGMYKVVRERYREADGRGYQERILPLSHVRRSCHLVPEFGSAAATPVIDSRTPFDALEEYENFYLNSYLDLHSFRLLMG